MVTEIHEERRMSPTRRFHSGETRHATILATPVMDSFQRKGGRLMYNRLSTVFSSFSVRCPFDPSISDLLEQSEAILF